METPTEYPKIQRMNATNSATQYSAILSDSVFNPEELLRITENPVEYLSEDWYKKDLEAEKWRRNAGMSILVKIPKEMLIEEVEKAFGMLGKINSLKMMHSKEDENWYVAIEFHKWFCNEDVTLECEQGCQQECRHNALRDKRLECWRILEGISDQFPAYYFVPYRRYNEAFGTYETINVPCTIYIEKPEDAANTVRLDGPTPSELERRHELSHLILSDRQKTRPPLLTRETTISIPLTMEERLAALETIIASQQKQLEELQKEVDSKVSLDICAVSKNLFLIKNGEYIFVKNLKSSE